MWPILFESSWLTLYSYPFLVGLGWGIAYQVSVSLLRTYDFSFKHFNLLMIGLFLSSWIGAKILFLIISLPSDHSSFSVFSTSLSFWLGGGFVFYGGLAGGFIFFFFYSLGIKKFPLSLSHYLLPGLCWGHAIGRIGCFLAGCCYGDLTNLPWAVYSHGHNRHPVQLYEAAGLALLGLTLYKMVKSSSSLYSAITVYLVTYSLLRFGLEFYRGDNVKVIGGPYGPSFSQWFSLLILTFWVGAIILFRRRKQRCYDKNLY